MYLKMSRPSANCVVPSVYGTPVLARKSEARIPETAIIRIRISRPITKKRDLKFDSSLDNLWCFDVSNFRESEYVGGASIPASLFASLINEPAPSSY